MSKQILIFRDTRDQTLKIEKKNAIPLELKLNVSKHGHAWKDIGDTLYNFSKDRDIDLLCTITNEQFDFLKALTKPAVSQ